MRSRSLLRRALPLVALCAVTSTGCAAEEDNNWGYVKLLLQKGDQADSPYPGTAEIGVTVQYRECLSDFYTTKPQWQADGVDGGAVFDEWQDKLCSISDSGHPEVDCTVKEIDQNIASDTGETNTLSITYAVTSEVQDRVVLIGPLPQSGMAGCTPGLDPVVRVTSARGNGASQDTIWSVQTIPEPEAMTGQRLPMRITARAS